MDAARRAALIAGSLLAALACGGNDDGANKTPVTGTGTGGAPGAGGAPVFAAGGSAGSAVACLETGGPCKNAGECCNPERTTCNYGNTSAAELLGCHPTCTASAECSTGCCLVAGGSGPGFCTDMKWCACGANGSRCGAQLPACCTDQLCVAGDAAGSFFQCAPPCTQDSDCTTTGCCIETTPGSGRRACLAALFCGR